VATGQLIAKSKDEYYNALATDDELYNRLVAALDARLNSKDTPLASNKKDDELDENDELEA
jgi:hypothetical protein